MIKKNYFRSRQSCPACNSKDVKEIYSSRFDEDPIKTYLNSFYNEQGKINFTLMKDQIYSLQECSNCSLIYQKNILDNEGMELLYNEWIDPNIVKNIERDIQMELFATHTSEILKILTLFNREPSLLKFLDFGMGWGQWLMVAKSFGINTWGSEISEERINFAKQRGINFVSLDSLPTSGFDFINTEQVLEHVANPLEILEILSDSLKPNGILKISVPTAPNIRRRLNKMDWSAVKGSKYSLNPIATLEHINYYNRISIQKISETLGLEEVFIPLLTHYRFSSNWYGFKKIIKNIVNPIFYNICKNRNYIFFKKNN